MLKALGTPRKVKGIVAAHSELWDPDTRVLWPAGEPSLPLDPEK